MIYDADFHGSCIYDFAEWGDRLYAGAESGVIRSSATGVGTDWDSFNPFDLGNVWELEVFQDHLYAGSVGGLGRIDADRQPELVWKLEEPTQGRHEVISMVADGDQVLYFGTGSEAGTYPYYPGAARVYAHDGVAVSEIFDGDGFDSDGRDHTGVQCLYLADDADRDGVADHRDVCPGTRIPEGVPTRPLGVNRWALVDGDFAFDTKPPKGAKPTRRYTTTDTNGCSCEQIIDALGLGYGHREFGCSIGAMDSWIARVRR